MSESVRIKIEQGMMVPKHIAESVEELEAEYAGIQALMNMLCEKASINRLKNERIWREVKEKFDLDSTRWRISRSPKTDLEWVFEALDSHGLNTKGIE